MAKPKMFDENKTVRTNNKTGNSYDYSDYNLMHGGFDEFIQVPCGPINKTTGRHAHTETIKLNKDNMVDFSLKENKKLKFNPEVIHEMVLNYPDCFESIPAEWMKIPKIREAALNALKENVQQRNIPENAKLVKPVKQSNNGSFMVGPRGENFIKENQKIQDMVEKKLNEVFELEKNKNKDKENEPTLDELMEKYQNGEFKVGDTLPEKLVQALYTPEQLEALPHLRVVGAKSAPAIHIGKENEKPIAKPDVHIGKINEKPIAKPAIHITKGPKANADKIMLDDLVYRTPVNGEDKIMLDDLVHREPVNGDGKVKVDLLVTKKGEKPKAKATPDIYKHPKGRQSRKDMVVMETQQSQPGEE